MNKFQVLATVIILLVSLLMWGRYGGGARRDKMYISPFWCGFITGAVVMFAGIIAWCERYNRRKK